MAEATATSASVLASALGTPQTDPDATQPIEEEVASQTEPETEETVEPTDETPEEELPEAVKDILKKNRKAVREAEARAVAAEKALAAKETPEGKEETPVDDKFKKLFVNTAAKSALTEAGLSTGTDRFLKLIDFDSVEVDEDGTITGLDDQIAELKDEFAELLTPKEAPKKTAVKSDGAGRRETPVTPKSSAQLLAERLRG